jgi:hypothetical protein
LAIPGVCAQRPALRKRHDRPLAPNLVINLHSSFGFDCAQMCCSFPLPFVASTGLTIAPEGAFLKRGLHPPRSVNLRLRLPRIV